MIPEKWDKEADVIVVGYGAAGAAAAIEAHDAGASVLILEKMAGPGGNTALTRGAVYGSNTSVQRAHGIQDSVEEMIDYVIGVSGGMVDEALVRQCCEQSGANIDWLVNLGVVFDTKPDILSYEDMPDYAARFPPRARHHRPGKQGRETSGLMRPLRNAVEARGIEVMLKTPMLRLISNPHTREVIGVKTDKGNIKARKAVVLATGGFGRNPEMVRNYLAAYKGVLNMGASGTTGDGIKAAQALGAGLANMGVLQPLLQGVVSGRVSASGDERVVRVPMITVHKMASCIIVDKNGKRFGDEFMHYAVLGPKMATELEDQTCFCIFDQDVKRTYGADLLLPAASEGLVREIEGGMLITAPTIEELASKLGIDPEALRETLATFNRNAEKGMDPQFGRKMHLVPVKEPPFYAMRYKPTFMQTVGGIKINTRTQVVDVFGNVISRLYATGETTGGHVGQIYPSSGWMLMYCFATGRTAGKVAAGERPWDN
ncbi:MAG: FAD-dependent oxidoreductase [Dehalococcoidia bacterium]|nr:FAD-dependent oxidoreductase [Dehalococcoidia bacterium]